MTHGLRVVLVSVFVALIAGISTSIAAPEAAGTYLPVLQRASETAGPSPTSTVTPVCPTCRYVPLVRAEIVPTDLPTPTLAPTATPPAPILQVRSYRLFQSPSGSSLYAVGEVFNGTSKPAYFVKVVAKFYDGFGAFVATDYTYTYLERLAPGQLSPFRIILSNAPAAITSATFTVTASSSPGLTYVPMTIVSQQTRDNSGVEIFGEIRNDQAKEVKNAQIVVTFYDGSGGVYDVDYSYADISPLAPGALSTYRISTFDEQLAGLPYALQAEGYFTP